jgi:TIR domain
MKVFISWSGELSRQLAGAIRDWLPTTLQYVKPYFSPADIEKGAKWENEISKELGVTNFCIIALTRESLNSKWIMFEAGAISRSVVKPLVSAILFDIQPADVEYPLATFQHTKFVKEDIRRLLKTTKAAAAKANSTKRAKAICLFEALL